jgi:hypothetical protein
MTLSALSACDIVLGERRTVSHRLGSRAFFVKSLIAICATLGLAMNSAMVSFDETLYFSATDSNYGDKYGSPNW